MDGSEHGIYTGFGRQEDDQVVPEIDIDPSDDLICKLMEHVLMCNKVVDFLIQETQSAQKFPDPFNVVRHEVRGDENLSRLRILIEIENRPMDKSTLELLGTIIIYNCAGLEIDEKSFQQASSENPRISFKFVGLPMSAELQLVSPNQPVTIY